MSILLRLSAMALMALALALPASAQRHSRDWVLLGEQTVGFRTDRDTITVGREGVRFSQLRIQAERADVHLISLRLVYQNGYAEQFQVDRELRAGADALPVDLRGERSWLRQIELVYRSRPNFEGRAVVRVYGELRGGPPPQADRDEGRDSDRRGDRRDFDVIGTQRISRNSENDIVFDIGRREGRFSSLRFQAKDGDVRINSVRITYGNGETQRVDVDDRIGEGQMSRPIDLEGDRRFIRSVRVNGRPARGARSATLVLLAREDAGRREHREPPPQADRGRDDRGGHGEWVTLGVQKAALLKTDTDVFQVGREMGTFRAIRAVVSGQDVQFFDLSIRYGNGEVENVPLAGKIRAGEASQPFDLRGRDRFIESITFRYRSKISLRGPGRIEIQGLKHGPYRDR